MKICSKCGAKKPESEYFVKDKTIGKLHAQCKICYKEHRATYYASHYAKYKEEYLRRAKLRRDRLRAEFRKCMLNYLSRKSCLDCGEADVCVLELDHLDPAKKKFSISQAIKLGFSWKDVELELQKCQVLCANCHKKRTARQFGWYEAMH